MAQLQTKRIKLADVLVCAGCCCGHIEKGHPAVPVAWLKEEWRRRGLLKTIQLTIAGCIGPCDLPNVLCITTGQGSTWIGNIDQHDHYQALLTWAVQSKTAGTLAPLPREFHDKLFSPFEGQEILEAL
jgi:hypothetical protein